MKSSNKTSLFNGKILLQATIDSVTKLNPASQIKNPVIFMVAVGAVLTTIIVFVGLFHGSFSSFNFQIAIWLWFTVLFANFAEAIAEGRGKAQADSLRKNRTQTHARKMVGKQEVSVIATELKKGDIVVCETGDVIPSDGEIIEGIASVDESAITGESAPVIRESGGDRSAVTGGTKVISDRVLIRITCESGDTFIDRMIALVEGAKRQKTPNEIALIILLSGLTIIFLLVVICMPAYFGYSLKASGVSANHNLTLPVLFSLLVCLIPTTIGGLLSAIGISGMDRLLRKNVIATSGKAIEAAGDTDVLLLDKTGTITLGNRMATEFIPAEGFTKEQLADAAQLASLADETPEGRSIVILAKEQFNIRAREMQALDTEFVPFTAQTSMSGLDLKNPDGQLRSIRKGSSSAIRKFIERRSVYAL